MTIEDDYVEWRTTLKPSDAPPENRLDKSESRREYYKRLAVTNTLTWNGKWVDQDRITAKSEAGLIDSIGSSLELTDFQRKRAQRWYNSLPDNYLNAYPMALLILCTCGLSGRDDGRDYHPDNLRRNKPDDEFSELADTLGFSYRQLYSCWNRIRGEISDV